MSNMNLGSPTALGSLQFKNRLWFAGHVTNFSDGPHLSERHHAYHVERVIGGVGGLVSDPLPIHQSSDTLRTKLALTKETRRSFEALIKFCHEYAVPAVLQLFHVGAHGCAKTAFMSAWSPSGCPSLRDQDGSHEMSSDEINTLIESFITHAREAKDAGFDGIEIVAGGNMLMEQFWSALSNSRQDAWGGSFEGRMAFSGEVVKRIRAEMGTEFLIGMVMTTNQGYGNSLSREDLEKILSWHDELCCIDYFSFCLNIGHSDGLAGAITELKHYRSLLKKGSLQVSGNVRTIEIAEKILENGAADFIGMTRALMADPALMIKYQRDQRTAVRPCIGCNQGCIGRRARDYAIACLVNPSAGREMEFPAVVPKTKKALNIVVVGGGLAGMEAARSAAEAGHQVTLVEQGEHLGGQWRLAARLPGREAYGELLNWYAFQFASLGIKIRMGEELRGNDLPKIKFDHLIIATGAGPTKTGFQRLLPNRPKLPGVDSNNVYSVEEVLEGITPLCDNRKANVLLLDDIGFRQGIGTAIFLARQGHSVSLLTRHAVPAAELQSLCGHNELLSQLKSLGVKVLTGSVLLAWSNCIAEYAGTGDSTSITSPFDFLVLATTNDANQMLEHEAARHCASYSLAGDCQGARKAHTAIYEGRKAIMKIHRGEESC